MLVLFKDKKLEKECSDERFLQRRWGQEKAKKIALRITQLRAADNLEVLKSLPQVRAHELVGDKKGVISLDLKHPYRLLLVSNHADTPVKADGGLDWNKITEIQIIGIEDTHG